MSVTADGVAQATVDVLVVNWNGAHYLPRCLQSLREQTADGIRVMLIDNGSTDDSVVLTRRSFPEVKIVELGHNFGYAEANNRAASMSDARYLFFLNNDTYLDPNALQSLISAGEARPRAAIFAPQQRSYDGARTLHTGLALDVLGYPCSGKTFYADGAALFIRREVFRALGGFDAHYFMFFEEADLCWRAWVYGYRVESVPEAIVYHRAGGTAGSSIADEGPYVTSIRKRRLAHRNQLATVYKNYSLAALWTISPILLLVVVAEVAALLLTGQRAALRDAYLPAWRDLWRERHYLRKMRRQVQTMRRVGDAEVLRHMSRKLGMLSVLLRSGLPRVS